MHSYFFLSENLEWGHALDKFGNLHFYTTFTFTQQECFALTNKLFSSLSSKGLPVPVKQPSNERS